MTYEILVILAFIVGILIGLSINKPSKTTQGIVTHPEPDMPKPMCMSSPTTNKKRKIPTERPLERVEGERNIIHVGD